MSQPTASWNNGLQIASVSDVGMRRASNQDSFTVSLASGAERWKKRGHLFMVADGMGAHAAGELASELAVEQIPHLYNKYQDLSAPEALKRAVVEANGEINRRGQANEDFYNMGTTCSVLTLLPQGAVVAHIGDSRIYRMRGNTLEQLTFDHSLVWEMRATGQLSSDDEASNLVPKNVITRSLGPYPDVKVDLEGPFPTLVGDTFLLCSDGLTGQVPDTELGPLLANLQPEEAARVLADLANLRGGPDNITIVIVRIMDQHMASATAPSKPLTVGKQAGSRTTHPIVWAGLVAGLIGAVALGLATNSLGAAAIPGLLALGSLIWICARLANPAARGVAVTGGKRFGKGPYASVNCSSGKELIDQLETITAELNRAAVEEGWPLDWTRLEAMVQQAHRASKAGDAPSAISSYARGISFMMDQLRRQSNRLSSDSSVDL